MPIKKVGSTILYTPPVNADTTALTGVMQTDGYAFCDPIFPLKQIHFDCSGQADNSDVIIKSGPTSGTVTITLPTASGTLLTTATANPVFRTMQTPFGTSPVATGPADTLTFGSVDSSIVITGNSSTDTVDFVVAAAGVSQAGAVTTGAQTFAGFKTFLVPPSSPIGDPGQSEAWGNGALANSVGTGWGNTAVGANSMHSDVSGYQNAAMGYLALFTAISPYQNAVFGAGACYSMSAPQYVSAFGYNCARPGSGLTAYASTFVGAFAGNGPSIASANNTIFLGVNAGMSQSGNLDNTLVVGDTGGSAINDIIITSANAAGPKFKGNYQFSGQLSVSTTGFGLSIKGGSNAKVGTAVLNGTTGVVVSNTSVTANSLIFAYVQIPGGTLGSSYVSAISVGASFTLKSTNVLDTSTVAWMIVEQT